MVSSVRADEVSGTWTGALEGRANYYWERSTRVVVPSGKLELAAPNGMRVGAGYLVDVISSASIAQGVEEDEVHTEIRQGPTAELGNEFDLGEDSQLDLSVHGTYSTESDYESLIYGLQSTLTLNDKNTRLRLSASRVQDEIRRNRDPSFEEELSGIMLGGSVEQVLSPTAVLNLGYNFGYLEGFLGNAYRRVAIGPPQYEQPPRKRFRHTASARLAFMIPATSTAVHLMCNGYLDSWEIAAINPELRIHQHFGRDFVIRPRYRFYAQTKASFQRDAYPADWDGPFTSDPKLTEFTTHTFGASFDYRLGFLEGTVLDFARNTWLDLSFDRYLSTNAFGNGVIGTAGGRILF